VNAERTTYGKCVIKSFKHDGSLHRVWFENWVVPPDRLHPDHRPEKAWILINEHTTIREADGREWISRVPAVSFFLPDLWYNVVALIEEEGIRYYCNLASPPYRYDGVLTYIDYDLDVLVTPDGKWAELDRDEYSLHKNEYKYGSAVEERVSSAMEALQAAIQGKRFPFGDEQVRYYYEEWKLSKHPSGEEQAP